MSRVERDEGFSGDGEGEEGFGCGEPCVGWLLDICADGTGDTYIWEMVDRSIP